MTSGEITALCTAIVGAGGVVGGIIKLLGNSLISTVSDAKVAINRNTDATLKFVEASARLEGKLDQAHAAANRAADAVEEVADEISGVHRAAEGFEMRTPPGGYPTPPGGYSIQRRPGTKGGR
jgi:hypothetical protein